MGTVTADAKPAVDSPVANGSPFSAAAGAIAATRSDSLVDQVYHQVLARIVRGELPGGSELKSTQLADQLGVSRTPVVQALSRLIADGIVTQRMNMRAVVRPGAENWLIEIHELRILLEPSAAARAAQLITDDAIAKLERMAAEVAPNTDSQWFKRARQFDFELHQAIADHCGNQPLRGAIHKCWQYKGLSYELGPDRSESILRGYEEHLSILAALKARDVQTASAAMELHLRHASSYRPETRIV
jgi:DNA-binding GntR family transcriptional regulator